MKREKKGDQEGGVEGLKTVPRERRVCVSACVYIMEVIN